MTRPTTRVLNLKVQSIVSSPNDVEALVRAWCDEGINPAYHNRIKQALKRDWPTLYTALDRLMEGNQK